MDHFDSADQGLLSAFAAASNCLRFLAIMEVLPSASFCAGGFVDGGDERALWIGRV